MAVQKNLYDSKRSSRTTGRINLHDPWTEDVHARPSDANHAGYQTHALPPGPSSLAAPAASRGRHKCWQSTEGAHLTSGVTQNAGDKRRERRGEKRSNEKLQRKRSQRAAAGFSFTNDHATTVFSTQVLIKRCRRTLGERHRVLRHWAPRRRRRGPEVGALPRSSRPPAARRGPHGEARESPCCRPPPAAGRLTDPRSRGGTASRAGAGLERRWPPVPPRAAAKADAAIFSAGPQTRRDGGSRAVRSSGELLCTGPYEAPGLPYRLVDAISLPPAAGAVRGRAAARRTSLYSGREGRDRRQLATGRAKGQAAPRCDRVPWAAARACREPRPARISARRRDAAQRCAGWGGRPRRARWVARAQKVAAGSRCR